MINNHLIPFLFALFVVIGFLFFLHSSDTYIANKQCDELLAFYPAYEFQIIARHRCGIKIDDLWFDADILISPSLIPSSN